VTPARVVKAIALCLMMMVPRLARALPGTVYTPVQLGINGATLSTNPQFTLPVHDYTSVTLYINLTYTAATAVTLSCLGGNFADEQASVGVATVPSSGAITMANASWSYPTGGASRLFRIIVGPLADNTLTCIIGGTGATTDTVKVGAYGVH
jgi:hypothetical protein